MTDKALTLREEWTALSAHRKRLEALTRQAREDTANTIAEAVREAMRRHYEATGRIITGVSIDILRHSTHEALDSTLMGVDIRDAMGEDDE